VDEDDPTFARALWEFNAASGSPTLGRGEDYVLGFAEAFFTLLPAPDFELPTDFLVVAGFALEGVFFAGVLGAIGLFASSIEADGDVLAASTSASCALELVGTSAASLSSFWSFSPHSTSFEPTRLANGLHRPRIRGTVATAMSKSPAFPGGTIGRGRIVFRLTQVANFGCAPRPIGSMPID